MKNNIAANIQFIFMHIFRAPVKSMLVVVVTLFFVFALGFLQNAIVNFEYEVERLYNTTVVSGEVRRADRLAYNAHDLMQNNILGQTVDSILSLGYFQWYYIDSGALGFNIILFDEYGIFPADHDDDFWEEFLTRGNMVNPLLAVNDLDALVDDSADVMFIEGYVNFIPTLEIQFAEGFSQADFVYDDYTLQKPIPVIINRQTLYTRGLSLGDTAFIVQNPSAPTIGDVRHPYYDYPVVDAYVILKIPIVVIGWHNGEIERPMSSHAVLLPIPAMRIIQSEDMNYITFRFDIDTAQNRRLNTIYYDVQAIVQHSNQNLLMEMTLVLRDEELRVVVGQMERNLSLLQIIYPIAIALSVIIGMGFAALLLLQNAKNAAIMRVLGYTKAHTRIYFCLEHIVLVILGIAIGLIIILLIDMPFVIKLPLLSLLYLSGAVAGSAIGVVIITGCAPLDLLQVRE